MNAPTYREDVLMRYNLKSAIKITQTEHTGSIEVVLEDGKRLWFGSRIIVSDMGITPAMEITFPDSPTHRD